MPRALAAQPRVPLGVAARRGCPLLAVIVPFRSAVALVMLRAGHACAGRCEVKKFMAEARQAAPAVTFLALELTGRCNLACGHCFAESGPSGTHGVMTTRDWERVIGEAAGLGVRAVQFIGGCLRTRRVP